MCTYFINYNCFNFSKVFIKICNTDISIATVHDQLYYFWILCVYIIANSSHTDQTCTGSFFTIVPFSSTESLTEYLIPTVVWVTITLFYKFCTVAPFHSLKFTLCDFFHAPLTLLSGEIWIHTLIIVHRNLAGLQLLLTNVLYSLAS